MGHSTSGPRLKCQWRFYMYSDVHPIDAYLERLSRHTCTVAPAPLAPPMPYSINDLVLSAPPCQTVSCTTVRSQLSCPVLLHQACRSSKQEASRPLPVVHFQRHSFTPCASPTSSRRKSTRCQAPMPASEGLFTSVLAGTIKVARHMRDRDKIWQAFSC
jgi:hypothetical protein